jgi:hypothetical protein
MCSPNASALEMLRLEAQRKKLEEAQRQRKRMADMRGKCFDVVGLDFV